jgi:deoxycytidylate deaminase
MPRKVWKQVDVFDKAINEAKKSVMNHRHGCVIVKDGEIVASGYNHMMDFMSHTMLSIHAECDAIRKVKNRGRRYLEQCSLVVVRLGSTDEFKRHTLKNSKPCEACTKEIHKCGINRVFYSAG